MKTDKDIFEIMANHLLNQKEKSMTKQETCAYRGYSLDQISEVEDLFKGEESYYDDYDFQQALINKFGKPKMMCGVGCLIKDEYYQSDIENMVAEHQSVLKAIMLSNPDWEINDSGIKLMKSIQDIHDNYYVEEWEEFLEKLSKDFDEHGNFYSKNFLEIAEAIL